MKLKMCILSVADHADTLVVEAQGIVGRGQQAPWRVAKLHVPATETNRRSYYVGRRLVVSIKPEADR